MVYSKMKSYQITVKETFFDANSGKKKTREYVVDTDEGPRAGTTMQALSNLKPVLLLVEQ